MSEPPGRLVLSLAAAASRLRCPVNHMESLRHA